MRFLIALLLVALAASPAYAAGGGDASKPKSGGHERKLTSSPNWVAVRPIIVTVMRQSQVQGMFLVEFGLDIPDAALRDKANETLPRLRDAWLRGMSDFAMTRVRVGRQADLDALTTRLQGVTDRMLGAPVARVLLQQAVVRQK